MQLLLLHLPQQCRIVIMASCKLALAGNAARTRPHPYFSAACDDTQSLRLEENVIAHARCLQIDDKAVQTPFEGNARVHLSFQEVS